MDFCGHLMKQCFETEEFILPEPVSPYERAKPTPLIFSREESEVNRLRCQKKQFYDQKICRHLCSKTLVLELARANPFSPCESMCFELTRSSDSAGEVCPFQKYCPRGCPCPYYQCEKLNDRQTMIPAFDLEKAETIEIKELTLKFNFTDLETKSINSVTGRWEDSDSKFTEFSLAFADFTSTNATKIEMNLEKESLLPPGLGNLSKKPELGYNL